MTTRRPEFGDIDREPVEAPQPRCARRGRPKRQGERFPRGATALIEESLAVQIDITENGTSRTITVLEAILTQLWTKQLTGDKRALGVLLKYRKVFANNDGKRDIVIKSHVAKNLRSSIDNRKENEGL
jgi:Family of unknown function (DUF5681)